MQAITTRILSATNHRSKRVSASCEALHIVVSSDKDSDYENHAYACQKLCEKLEWTGTLTSGVTHKGDTVWVFVEIEGVHKNTITIT